MTRAEERTWFIELDEAGSKVLRNDKASVGLCAGLIELTCFFCSELSWFLRARCLAELVARLFERRWHTAWQNQQS